MKHILIDTNYWIDLVSDKYADNVLNEIERRVKNEELVVIVPRVILLEWQNYRTAKRQDGVEKNIQKAIETRFPRADHMDTVESLSKYSRQAQTRIANRIQSLLEDSEVIELTDDVKVKVVDRYISRKAPFHKKLTSHNDALIFLSAVQALHSWGVSELTFVTSNKEDFSAVENYRLLHPDLVDPAVQIDYLFDKNMLLGLLFPTGLQSEEIRFLDQDTASYCFDQAIKTKLILEQWYLSLAHYFRELPYIPRHTLAAIYPHKKPKSDGGSGYSHGKLYVNNPELIEFLKTVQIVEGRVEFTRPGLIEGVEDAHNKMLFIINRLHSNLVFRIEDTRGELEIDFSEVAHPECNCIRCAHRALDYERVLQLLKIEPSSDSLENSRQAYVHYQLGNYSVAANFYYSLYEYYEGEGLELMKFICAYNLRQIERLMPYNQNFDFDLRPKIQKLNLETLRNTLLSKDDFSSAIIKRFVNDSFLYFASDEINELHNDIYRQYRAQFRGNHGTNTNLDEFPYAFEDLNSFLTKNSIVGNRYSNYGKLFEKVFEGYLMMSLFNIHQRPRLAYFDDYRLITSAHYAKPENLISAYVRFGESELKYQSSNEGQSAFDILLQLVSNYQASVRQYEELAGAVAIDQFKSNYLSQMSNLLVFAAISETDQSMLDKLSLALVRFVENYTEEYGRHFRKADGIAQFIGRKGKFFDKDLIRRLVLFVVKTPKLHRSEIVSALEVSLRHFPKLFDGFEIECDMITNTLFSTCESCRTNHTKDLLVSFFDVLPPATQGIIRSRVVGELQKSFDSSLFYTYAVHEIIDSGEFFEQYLASIPNLSRELKQQGALFWGGERSFTVLSELFNLCFAKGINTTSSEFDRFKGFSDYYDWLLDMENFDYSKFQVEWITEYSTVPFLNRILNCPKVVDFLIGYFKASHNEHLMKQFFWYNENVQFGS